MLSCECGQVKGLLKNITAKKGERVICYCRDCQACAHHLGHPEKLDEWGGTDVFLTTPNNMEFTSGIEHVACFQFSPSGPRRWYTTCCNTHLANTLPDPKEPLISLDMACVTQDSRAFMGDIRKAIFVADAHGNPTIHKQFKGKSRGMIFKIIFRMLYVTLLGQRDKSPLFIRDDQPISEPEILNRETRSEALSKAGF